MTVKLIQYQWYLWFRFRNLGLIIGLGLLIGISGGLSLWSLQNEVSGQLSVWDGVLITFLGPSSEYFSFTETITWLSILLVFLYLVALIPTEDDVIFVVMRSANSSQWFVSQTGVITIITLLFVAALFAGILFGVSLILPHAPQANVLLQYLGVFDLSTEEVINWGIILIFTTLHLLGTLYLTLCLLIRSKIYAYVVMLGISISSLIFPNISIWLPATQMMIRYHLPFSFTSPLFNFGWSLVYNGIGIILLTIIRSWLSKSYDFIRSEK